jgi:beta-glucosidase
MMHCLLVAFVCLSCMCISIGFAQQHIPAPATPTYQNPDFPIDERVNDLVGRMTLDEKVKQMLYDAPAIERLGVPAYNWWNEALHGVARSGRATVFPQAIGLAATWDTDLMRRVASAISDEARAKYHDALRKGRHGIYEGLTFWAPNINLFRDPRWGRGMETYGEDPYLSGRLAVEFVKGMQGDNPHYLKTIATPKHFAVHSGPEPERHTFNAVVEERDLRDTYLPQFRMAVIDGNARSVMCAYNRFRGFPCCGSDELLQKILRDEWGFNGYVVSDCWAIMDFYNTHKIVKTAPEAAAMALKAGTDLNCGETYDSLGVAVRNGLVREELVDRAVKRLFSARFQLGMFDPPERVPYASTSKSVVDSREHRDLAREAARKSIVLLKNDDKLLPLPKNIRTLAVIGPNANDVDVLLGNYNGIPSQPVTPLEGIRRKVGSHVNVIYSRGCEVAEHVPSFEFLPASVLAPGMVNDSRKGLMGEYFNNNCLSGMPVVTRTDTMVNFNWWDQPAMPELTVDTFSVRWTGMINPPVTGLYSFGVNVFGGCRLYLDDSLLIESSDRHVVSTQWKDVDFKTGQPRRIRIEYWHLRPDAIVKLVWSIPDPHLRDEAISVAREADVIIACMGLSPRLEGEEMQINVPGFSGGDRVDIGLPDTQEELLKTLATLNKPLVLVLLNGSALAIPWAVENVPAIVEAWYPGQAAGEALADVLFGDYNPSGHLPVTFYRSVDQLPPFTDYRMTGRTYRYFKGEPLYPFGYGLSYTSFSYSNLRLPSSVPSGDSIQIAVDVENTGDRAGEEVVQLYLTDLEASVVVPTRSLQGFLRVFLKPGERKPVSFTLSPRQLSLIDAHNERVLEPGIFEVSVGGMQPGIKGRPAIATTSVLTGRFEVTGSRLVLGEKR